VSRPDRALAVRVETVFQVADEREGREVAAKMIDRAQEIANLPECECDLDVTVRWDPPVPPASPVSPAPPVPPAAA
jgi:hypothetical protein